ncbi:MAG: hypothetical protein EU548_00915 [Promethearchaeota archaeon]|nr:MAG: hypothetical protein EU548_00915 [Candidatus Lokiarchaeota archaeon]
MNEDENIQKNLKLLKDLEKKGLNFSLKICPNCKSASITIMDVFSHYSPLSPVKHVCKNCGWTGRAVILMTNDKIDELDEEMLNDILNMEIEIL